METRPKEPKTTPRKGKSKFNFSPPPEAPVFEPSFEEFSNPLEYIKKIRIIGEKSGICKIIPPQGWKSPFVLQKDSLRFTPRIQRINELEARTRIKLNFIDQLTKFFALRGKTFQIPLVEKNSLDLYTLHRLVKEKGGIDEVTKEKKWTDIANEMGYISKTASSALKHNYEDLILPFLQSQKNEENHDGMNCSRNNSEKNSANHPSAKSVEEKQEYGFSKCLPSLRELKSLKFLGPGPKMAVCEDSSLLKENSRTRGKKILYEFDPLAKYMCKSCCTGDIEEPLVTCVTCQDRYHSSCLIPKLVDIPERWRCPKCVAAEVYKPLEDFGFAQAEREYSLNEFKMMADEFKSNYFKTDPTSVSTSKVEQEFWRVVSSIDEAVTVEYGADLHVIDHGSGFPRRNQPYTDGISREEFDKYADSPWNLNNLPVLNSSVLRYISADISGMKIPWMYAGMCFATFCWHNEDHWSYSINYLHLGEPKTWYGVSGSNAEKFEKAMKNAAPELFAAQPDLLHHLVTIMNPNDLMNAGVPVYRTDQKEGEFVITFPRAYHAGFNQGFNFAEACNFAPYDWLQMGRECVSHYSSLKRPCVFSHDELVCNMALIAGDLDRDIAEATLKDMVAMVNAETVKWNRAISFGINTVVEFNYVTVPDDERVCSECNTTVFLSSVFCPCNRMKLVCLEHIHKLCHCKPSNYIVKYQFRINFLKEMIEILKTKLYKFEEWEKKVENALSSESTTKISLKALTELLIEAKEKDFPQSDLIDLLEFQVRKSIDCSALARVIVGNGLAKRKVQNKLTIDDIALFYDEIENLPCTIMEANALKKLLDEALKFQRMAFSVLSKQAAPRARIVSCVKLGKSLDLDLLELPLLEKRLEEFDWVEKVETLIYDNTATIEEVKELLSSYPSTSTNRKVILKKEELTNHLTNMQTIKTFNMEALKISDIELNKMSVLTTSEQFHLKLPSKEIVKVNIDEVQSVQNVIEKVLIGEDILYVSELEALLAKAKLISVSSKFIVDLEEAIFHANRWHSFGKQVFLKQNSGISLMQALWPRRFEPRSAHWQNSLPKNVESLINEKDHNFAKSDFLKAFEEQFQSLIQLRMENLELTAKSGNNVLCRCVCGGDLTGYSIVCFLCKTSFHVSCFKTDGNVNSQMIGFTIKNICSYCTMTKRPTIESIGTLLSSGDKLKVKIPEFLALSYTYAKFLRWQKMTKNLFNSEELLSGLNSVVGNVKETCEISEDIWCQFKMKVMNNNLKKNDPSTSRTYPLINLRSQIKLSAGTFADLRQMMLLGDLLEFTSQEMEQLWIFYDAWQMRFHQPTFENISLPANLIEESLSSNSMSPKKLEYLETNVKTTAVLQRKVRQTKKAMYKPKSVNVKSIKKKTITDMSGCIPESLSDPSPAKIIRRRRRRSVKTSKKCITQLASETTLHDQVWEEHEVGDPCAASNCQKPTDLNVSWVQCDGQCGQWFHMKCVDLESNNLGEEDEFKCHKCTASIHEEDWCPPFKKIKLPLPMP